MKGGSGEEGIMSGSWRRSGGLGEVLAMQAGRVPTERAVIWATCPTRPSE